MRILTYVCYDLTKLLLWVAFRLGFGLEVRGQEHVPKRGGFVVASNHVSYLDPPLIGVACPRQLSFMARSSLFGHLLLGAFLRAVHVIPIARGESDMGAIREALSRLRHGEGVAIFPEGGRQLSGALGAAKRGVGFLAATARVPIVPAVVTGTFQALPPSSNRLHPAKIRVAFGPAIPYTTSPVSSTSPSAARAAGGGAGAKHPRSCHQDLADAVTHAWHNLAEQRIEPLNH